MTRRPTTSDRFEPGEQPATHRQLDGLGGFLPPIVMGLAYQATGDFAIGLMLLSDVALAGLVFTAWRLGPRATARDAEPGRATGPTP